eukprot:1146284-Pelagomonas_calceolata.AAC.1
MSHGGKCFTAYDTALETLICMRHTLSLTFFSFFSFFGSQILNSFMGALRECGREPIQFNWFRATLRHYNSLIHCKGPLLQKIFPADIDLSSRHFLAGLHTYYSPQMAYIMLMPSNRKYVQPTLWM